MMTDISNPTKKFLLLWIATVSAILFVGLIASSVFTGIDTTKGRLVLSIFVTAGIIFSPIAGCIGYFLSQKRRKE